MKIDPAELANLSPFPGLRPFSQKEADRFFGRRQHVAELAAMLHQVRFIAVSGTSGCGKSSLVRAGLLDALQKSSAEPGAAVKWRTALLRPGGRPSYRLAQALVDVLWPRRSEDEALTLYGELNLGGLGLVDMVRRARLADNERLLVVVDQFEEVFRFRQLPEAKTLRDTTTPLSLDEATAFVKLLLNAAEERDGKISVVITLRSDTLGGTEEFRGLPEAINRGLYMVPRLTRDQRKEAIVAPVQALGFQVAPSLVQRLLNDVSDSFDDLPVMQHALSRTWRQWCLASGGSRPIDLGDYEAENVGTARNALSIHADEAYHELEDKGLGRVVEKVFRALTERSGQARGLRRPLPFDTLCQVVGGAAEDVAEVVNRYRCSDTAFLTPSSKVDLKTNPVIDISHESLMRQWRRLIDWANAEHGARTLLLRLCDAADRGAELWRGRELEEALEWEQRTKPSAAWVGLCLRLSDGTAVWQSAREFLDNSKAAAQRSRRERQVLKGTLIGLTGLTILVLLVALLTEMRSAVRVQADGLISRAELAVGTEPARAARLARRAWELDRDSPKVEQILRRSVVALETAHLKKEIDLQSPVVDIERNADRSILAISTAHEVTLFDAATFDRLGPPVKLDMAIDHAWPAGDGHMLVTWTRKPGALRSGVMLHRPGQAAGHEIACVRPTAGPATAVALSPDSTRVAIACADGGIDLWDLTQPALLRETLRPASETPAIHVLAWSSDGVYLASGDTKGGLAIWKAGVKGSWIDIPASALGKGEGSDAAIRDLALHRAAGQDWLGVASDSNYATKLSLNLDARRVDEGPQSRRAYDHDRPVTVARFFVREDRSTSLMTVSDKRIWFWEDESKQRQVRRHEDWINDAEPSPNGEYVVSASDDGTARVWSTRARALVAELRGHHDVVTNARFGRDETEIITAGRDGTVLVWTVKPPQVLWSKRNRWVMSAAVSPDGQTVAICGERQGAVEDSHSCDLVPWQAPTPSGTVSMGEVQRDGADTVNQLSWSPDARRVLGRAFASDIDQSERVVVWTDAGRDVTPRWLNDWAKAAFAAQSGQVLTLDSGGKIAVWAPGALESDEAPQKALWRRDAKPGRRLAAISPDGRWVAVASEASNEVTLIDSRGGADTILGSHGGEIKSMQFSADGERLLTTSNDRTARVWSTLHPTKYVSLEGGHRASLSFGSFSPDGSRVVTASADNTVRVWDPLSGRELVSLEWHREGVNEAHFTSDGRSLLTASDDGSVKRGACSACVDELGEIVKRVDELARLPRKDADALGNELVKDTPWYLAWFKP
ncbi:NACHT and WD repeat domain-containing protein [Ideonella sp. YS5]|uniref:NACHT and WD repeat domain-containing protein n=1 Tax=Ideonella sp. YS5 TaxID=3453714 RepID=UPI003EEEBE6E